MCWGTPLTEASVPTGIKTGLSIAPWGVRSVPKRAGPSLAEMEKPAGILMSFRPQAAARDPYQLEHIGGETGILRELPQASTCPSQGHTRSTTDSSAAAKRHAPHGA